MKILFHLSGENLRLSKMEVIYLLKAYNQKFRVIEEEGEVFVIETEDYRIFRRLALCHRVVEFWDNIKEFEGSFAVRIKGKNTFDIEKKIAAEIHKKYGNPVNLENPENEIYGIKHDKLYIGRTLFVIDRKGFERRKPQFRPYFHPSSLHPKYARALVNLSQAKKEVLDPFCGTGGILIEAGLMGLRVFGIDIEKKMVEGCKKNLDFYGIKDYSIKEGSAEDLDSYFQDIESTATDVPYGKSTKLRVKYEKTFEKIYETSKNACIVLNREYNFEKIGFEVLDMEKLRMHRSLTRYIYVLKCD